MSKKKRPKQTAIRHQAYLPEANALITFGPTTRQDTKTPFCAYYGRRGETCSITTGLKVVLSLPSIPPTIYMACPLHYGEVYQQTEQFLATLPSSARKAAM